MSKMATKIELEEELLVTRLSLARLEHDFDRRNELVEFLQQQNTRLIGESWALAQKLSRMIELKEEMK
jgi:hypothetical protein